MKEYVKNLRQNNLSVNLDKITKTDIYKSLNKDFSYSQVTLQEIFLQELRTRYLRNVNRPKKARNYIVDSLAMSELISRDYNYSVDNYFINFKLSNDFINVSDYSISEYFSEITNTPKVPIYDIVYMLGYTPKKIKELLSLVKRKHLDIILIGLGGFSRNFLYILKEFCVAFNQYKIFKKFNIYENDSFEISNIFRFMDTIWRKQLGSFSYDVYSVDTLYNINENNWLEEYSEVYDKYTIDKTTAILQQHRIPKTSDRTVLCNAYSNIAYNFEINNIRFRSELCYYDNPVIIGAPDIATREELYNENYNFLCALHRDEEMYLWATPQVNNNIMRESYGKIDLNRFFLSMYAITIKILESLANGDYEKRDELLANIHLNESDLDMKHTSRKYCINFTKDNTNEQN